MKEGIVNEREGKGRRVDANARESQVLLRERGENCVEEGSQ